MAEAETCIATNLPLAEWLLVEIVGVQAQFGNLNSIQLYSIQVT